MSRKRHRSKRDTENVNSNNNQQQMNFNNPFGINPNQLLSMFGNIDMNQINSMLQSMTTDGFDFNNLNLGPLQNLMGLGRNNQPMTQQNSQAPQNSQMNIPKVDELDNLNSANTRMNKTFENDDDNIEMLNSLRNIVDGERREFIDKIIRMYREGAFEE